ncbi:hypothetical protein, partial [Actinoplanes sp. GCM10030250]|uniref:hypothetical protein n=1 Tax=Actinoplanes sp. GCM10030250 TaxID=3273376 RepID=UPI0036077381
MTFPEVLPSSEFRRMAPQLVKDVAATPTRRVYVGAHRRPEAVLMSVAADVPDGIREYLLTTFFAQQADIALPAGDGDFLHVGDGFGHVFAWLWRVNPREAMDHLAGYLVALRKHPDAPATPIGLEDVLEAMRLTIDITDTEYAEICELAREVIP